MSHLLRRQLLSVQRSVMHHVHRGIHRSAFPHSNGGHLRWLHLQKHREALPVVDEYRICRLCPREKEHWEQMHGLNALKKRPTKMNQKPMASEFYQKQQTLAVIGPDAVAKCQHKKLIEQIQSEGFIILESKELTLSTSDAEEFYKEQREESSFGALVQYMSSGPVIAMKLERENAVAACQAMAASDGALYRSNSVASAIRELNFYFPPCGTPFALCSHLRAKGICE